MNSNKYYKPYKYLNKFNQKLRIFGKITKFTTSKNINMKVLSSFTIKRKTEFAVLISANVDELNQDLSFWLPLSKITETEKEIQIDDEFWNTKLEELKTPKEVEKVQIYSSINEKGEKATKLAIEVLFNERAIEMFLWFPNTQIENVESTQDEENKEIFIVTLPKWIWEKGFTSAIEKQLQYYNKDEVKYSESDFTLISKIN